MLARIKGEQLNCLIHTAGDNGAIRLAIYLCDRPLVVVVLLQNNRKFEPVGPTHLHISLLIKHHKEEVAVLPLWHYQNL